MTIYSQRSFELIDVPLHKGIHLPNSENVAFKFSSGLLDIGSICYLRRENGRRVRGSARKVDFTSFSETRASEVRRLIYTWSEYVEGCGLRDETVRQIFQVFMNFVDWCDLNSHFDVLATLDQARIAFRAFSKHLQKRVSENSLSNNTGARYQVIVRTSLEIYFEVEEFEKGINRIIHIDGLTTPTAVPDDAAQSKVIEWSNCLFKGLTELVLDKKDFPFALTVPEYLDWPNNTLWVLPLRVWCTPPHLINQNHQYLRYDYETGNVRTKAQIEALCGKGKYPSDIDRRIKRGHKIFEEANRDFNSKNRLARAFIAAQSFLLLFIAHTGMNSAQVIDLRWNQEFENAVKNPSIMHQHFRGIKYRANNRLVTFEIGVGFLPHLRRYLKLRNYLLQGKNFDFLFFSYGANLTHLASNPIPLHRDSVFAFFDILKRLSPDIPSIPPRQWRAAKQDFVIRNFDPASAALAMQHSLETSLKKYSNGSEVAQQLELSAYLNKVEGIVIEREREPNRTEIRTIGNCSSPQNPTAISDQILVAPNCSEPESCLFCEKYRAHADMVDTRKLLSARHCIKKLAQLTSNFEHSTKVFGQLLQRIDAIVTEIRGHDREMVDIIELEVDRDGELDKFWLSKLEALMELELI